MIYTITHTRDHSDHATPLHATPLITNHKKKHHCSDSLCHPTPTPHPPCSHIGLSRQGQNRVEELVVLRSRRLRTVRLVHVCFGPWLRVGLGFILGRLRCAAAFAAFEETGAVHQWRTDRVPMKYQNLTQNSSHARADVGAAPSPFRSLQPRLRAPGRAKQGERANKYHARSLWLGHSHGHMKNAGHEECGARFLYP